MARVRFVLTSYALASGRVMGALKQVFGNKIGKYANCSKPLTIECSAERFCRFLITRNERDAHNSFKDLKLQIIEPVQKPEVISFD